MKTIEKASPTEDSTFHRFRLEDLRKRYDSMTASCHVKGRFTTELVGGQPATLDGIRAYVQHHLGLEGKEAEQAIDRILREEIGERPIPSETGELEEKITYGINVLRRDSYGPWLASHMPRACMKAAATRLGIFQEKRGSKGDMEISIAEAAGISLLNRERPDQIYLIGPDGGPAKTYFRRFQGKVSGPKGSVSIQHDSECVAPGTRFEFILRFGSRRISMDDMADMWALAMVIGLGSVKALDRGKFAIDELLYSGLR
jgi:hypothetical protein